MVLFSDLTDGASSENYDDFKPRYDSLIGSFEALAITIYSRPIPGEAKGLLSAKPFSELCTSEFSEQDCLNVSAPAVAGLVVLLSDLKEAHKAGELAQDLLSIMKRQYVSRVSVLIEFETLLQDKEN